MPDSANQTDAAVPLSNAVPTSSMHGSSLIFRQRDLARSRFRNGVETT